MEPPEFQSAIEALAGKLGYPRGQSGQLDHALTHRTFYNEQPKSEQQGLEYNERLEFLGDAVLDLVIADALMKAHPHANEGSLSRLRSTLVKEASLAALARKLHLGALLLMGHGEIQTGGRGKDTLLADAFEAVIGALFLDCGFHVAQKTVLSLFREALRAVQNDEEKRDPKTALQELTQGCRLGTPSYAIVECEGPEHAQRFTVEVKLGDEVLAVGHGDCKKSASLQAAQIALQKLEARRNPEHPEPRKAHKTRRLHPEEAHQTPDHPKD